MNVIYQFTFILVIFCLTSFTTKDEETKLVAKKIVTHSKYQEVTIKKSTFGITPEGEKIDSYKLKNQNGMEVDIITYGGIITDLKVPNKKGISENVVIGFKTLEEYLQPNPYVGAIIGRYANRIANGKFSLDGKEYQLTLNRPPHSLHGGEKGFNRVVWKAVEVKSGKKASLRLSYLSKDLEEGYPGNLQVCVTYTLTNENQLEVLYEATTDKETIVNLTQHSYFNLSGDFSNTILEHEVVLQSDKIVSINENGIPTGEFEWVANTPFDFRTAKKIGKEIGVKNEQLERGNGYDHCWVLNNSERGKTIVAKAYDKVSGRLLEVTTDEPGIQLYTGNFLKGNLPMRTSGFYEHRTGFCFETQHFPDSPNQSNFPTTVLIPGKKYKTKTTFTFSVN
ncbi:aldose epimerase family protein [Flavobacterium sp. NG2]|uniref:aldose epimerase family protein n=1 Tax=Flavobacterium sp. NG2 TaxID=3097547 RepID=UPI002A82A3D4|nr:aldose epimerase family protein [Flavobacterium sp. NG2]WPR70860.1 aldose epimerase family protein [Flavobacterium sp. NG2]